MADLLQLLHEQPVAGATSLVVAHGLGRDGLIVQVIDSGGKPQPTWITSSQPTAASPLNSFDLTFSQAVTGRLQIFGSTAHSVQLPSASQSVNLVASSAYGSERFYAEQALPNTHTSESLLVANTLNATVEGGVYALDWYYEWALNYYYCAFLAEVRVDGVAVAHQFEDPWDSSGASALGSQSGTDQIHPVQGFWEGTLTPGAHTIELLFATQNNDYQATVYQSRLRLTRVG